MFIRFVGVGLLDIIGWYCSVVLAMFVVLWCYSVLLVVFRGLFLSFLELLGVVYCLLLICVVWG